MSPFRSFEAKHDEQVDQTKAPGTSAGQRPEPLAGPGKEPQGLGGRIKRFFLGDKMDAEKLKALGEQQLLSAQMGTAADLDDPVVNTPAIGTQG